MPQTIELRMQVSQRERTKQRMEIQMERTDRPSSQTKRKQRRNDETVSPNANITTPLSAAIIHIYHHL